MIGAQIAFWLLAPVMVLASLGMILARKPVHSALCLATVMICLAVQYAALDAPFLFAVQIIVYTGAVLMLFLFVLMLVGVDAADSLVETIKGQRPLAALAGIGFGSLLIFATGNAVVGSPLGLTEPNAAYGGNVQGLAALIFNRYVFAFEATSALLITAALGAMVLAHRERLSKKRGQAELVAERMQRYAESGEHPGPLPTPGVFARHNAVDTPALLPDGSAAESSVSATLRARGAILDSRDLAAPIQRTMHAIDPDGHSDPDDAGGPSLPVSTTSPTRPELVEGPLRQAQDTENTGSGNALRQAQGTDRQAQGTEDS